MERIEKIKELNQCLLEEMPDYKRGVASFPADIESQRRLLRSLMNIRYPNSQLSPHYIKLQDELLTQEKMDKGIVDVLDIPVTSFDSRIAIWQGDITRLNTDAIVNAANSQMLGCFVPCHGCIDNAIHSAAGLQLRDECAELMRVQGHEEPTGNAKITKGYNLPARFVLHTVGPIVLQYVTEENRKLLAACYRSCMGLADEYRLESIAFCCISTGEFHFPNDLAASIATTTVREYLAQHTETSIKKVIFNVFKNIDRDLYNNILS